MLVVLYGCETWSLTLSEERRLRAFENKALRGIFGAKREGRRPLGRPRRRWVDNIRTDLQEVGCGYTGLDWPRIETGGGRL